MTVKKSELYSVLWEACNKLRGGVEPSRYKDYVLVLLFFKYVSDKYKGERFAEFTIGKNASFDDLVKLKGKEDIGEKVDKILQKFLEDNKLKGLLPDVSFNNSDELGKGKELVDKVSGLIAIFENPAIDFKSNVASGDDIIGDAYEYFMMKFAQESGKSKGQFYTPSEVSRVIARLIGIGDIKLERGRRWTLHDPAAGSGSLLIRAADEAPLNDSGKSVVDIYAQEKYRDTAGLAKMNFILHNKGTSEIVSANTLSDPQYTDNFGELKKFDFIVMNPPFSDKDWSDGIIPSNDQFGRFGNGEDDFGIPPEKNGDYAWFLHVLKALKSTGKAGIILPHGVLFRGNAEENIRKKILQKKYIKGIVSLPANLFYGTGIPACIIIIDKEKAEKRKGIFFIDASQGFKKDGNKNRLREQDIEKIVQTFNNNIEIEGYSRFVSNEEIEKNEWNLNVPRYIQKIDDSLSQNIASHLKGGIPKQDIDALSKLWSVSLELKDKIFKLIDKKKEVYKLAISPEMIEDAVFNDPNISKELSREKDKMFNKWKDEIRETLLNINKDTNPKTLIREISQKLLSVYKNTIILDKYEVYDSLLNYWNEKLQDDTYIIKSLGYKSGSGIDYEEQKKTKAKIKSFEGTLIPKEIIAKEYFSNELKNIEKMKDNAEMLNSKLQEQIEEEAGEDSIFQEVLNDAGDSIRKGRLNKRIKELENKLDKSKIKNALKESEKYDEYDEYKALISYKKDSEELAKQEKAIKDKETELDEKVKNKYGKLSVDEIKYLLFEKKWMAIIQAEIFEKIDLVLNEIVDKVATIAKRYDKTLGEIEKKTEESRKEVRLALERMGYKW
ncbi:MAG: N-6 DNA methylase [Bdellovibrionota bacterium]|jgi:type I restriction enzyme M protein